MPRVVRRVEEPAPESRGTDHEMNESAVGPKLPGILVFIALSQLTVCGLLVNHMLTHPVWRLALFLISLALFAFFMIWAYRVNMRNYP